MNFFSTRTTKPKMFPNFLFISLVCFVCIALMPNTQALSTPSSSSSSSSDINSSFSLPSNGRFLSSRSNCMVQTFKILLILCPDTSNLTADRRPTPVLDETSEFQYDLQRGEHQASSQNDKKVTELLLSSRGISDRQVQSNRHYHRIKRSINKHCCHKACSISELTTYC